MATGTRPVDGQPTTGGRAGNGGSGSVGTDGDTDVDPWTQYRGVARRVSKLPYADAMAARDNYKLLIADNTYALAKMRLTPEQRRHLRSQRFQWQLLVERLEFHMARWTARATRANGGPLPF